MAHQAGDYPGFCGMKGLGVFVLSLGWDASPTQGYPPAPSLLVPIYTPRCMERGTVRVKCLAEELNTVFDPGLDPGPLALESSSRTMKPACLTLTNYMHSNNCLITGFFFRFSVSCYSHFILFFLFT